MCPQWPLKEWSMSRGKSGRQAILSKADLAGIRLPKAYLAGIKLIECNLEGAVLRGASFGGATLRGSRLAGADLAGAGLMSADLSHSDLRDAHLASAYAAEANLSDADLSRADMRKAVLDQASLVRARLVKADLSGARFIMARMDQAVLQGATMSKAMAASAKMPGACLKDANLRRANLSGCDMAGADLGGADLAGADLSGADLGDIRNWEQIKGIAGAWVFPLWNAPVGFQQWALGNGASPGARPSLAVRTARGLKRYGVPHIEWLMISHTFNSRNRYTEREFLAELPGEPHQDEWRRFFPVIQAREVRGTIEKLVLSGILVREEGTDAVSLTPKGLALGKKLHRFWRRVCC